MHPQFAIGVLKFVVGILFFSFLASGTKATDNYQDSLRQVTEVHGSDSLGLDALMLLSRSYWGENLDSALAISERAVQLVSGFDDPKFTYEAQSNLGVAHLFRGEYRDALDHFYSSKETAEEMKSLKKMAAANNNVAITLQELGNYSMALDFHLRAMELKGELGDSSSMQISMSNIGLLYEKLEDYKSSRHYYRRSLSMPGADSLRYATIYSNIGITYFEQGLNDSAKYFFDKSFSYSEPMGNLRLIGVHYQHLGALFEKEGRMKEAESEYRRALEVFLDLGKQDLVAEAMKSLGLFYLNEGNSQKALTHCQEGLRLARETGNLDKEADCLDCLRKAYKVNGNTRLALEKTEDYFALKDSLSKDAQYNAILRKDIEFVARQKQLADSLEAAKESELLRLEYEQELDRKESIGVYIGLAGLFFLGLALMFFINLQNKRRLSKFLEERVRERTAELERQNEQLAEYAYINAHLLRGPLAQVMGLVDLIAQSSDSVEREKYLEMMRLSTTKMDEVIHTIRDVVETPGQVSVPPSPTSPM